MWVHEDDCPYHTRHKMCFCIGPSKCRDTSCRQVQDYLREQKSLGRKIKSELTKYRTMLEF